MCCSPVEDLLQINRKLFLKLPGSLVSVRGPLGAGRRPTGGAGSWLSPLALALARQSRMKHSQPELPRTSPNTVHKHRASYPPHATGLPICVRSVSSAVLGAGVGGGPAGAGRLSRCPLAESAPYSCGSGPLTLRKPRSAARWGRRTAFKQQVAWRTRPALTKPSLPVRAGGPEYPRISVPRGNPQGRRRRSALLAHVPTPERRCRGVRPVRGSLGKHSPLGHAQHVLGTPVPWFSPL